jgi:hypothetical protein
MFEETGGVIDTGGITRVSLVVLFKPIVVESAVGRNDVGRYDV